MHITHLAPPQLGHTRDTHTLTGHYVCSAHLFSLVGWRVAVLVCSLSSWCSAGGRQLRPVGPVRLRPSKGRPIVISVLVRVVGLAYERVQ